MASGTVQNNRRGWQTALILLMVMGMVMSMVAVDHQPLHAEPDAPGPSPARRDSAAMTLLTAGVQIAPLLPDLLGFDKPQTYLLLVQNNHELRATGGFITAVGRVTVDNGRISDLEIQDSYEIARDDVDHPLAPEPVKRFMDIEILFLRDANWSPDFPTTAKFASSIYAQDTGVQVDGVVTVDLRAVELFVDALAPLEIPGAETALTGDNVMEQIMNFWNQPLGDEDSPEVEPETDTQSLIDRKGWVLQRKDFIPLIAQSAVARIQNGNFNPLALLDAVNAALSERAIQIWLADPAAAELMAEQGWDGRLRPQSRADYVALVDTNMGYNKVNAVLQSKLDYTVDWPDGPNAPAVATVAATYRHPLNVVDESCSPKTDYKEISSYSGMVERCYFGYLRLYVPRGSKLLKLEGVDEESISSQAGERGTEVFAGYFSVEPGEEHTVTFTYTLPRYIKPANYQLVVQRQAGTAPLPLGVEVGEMSLDTILVDGHLLWQPMVGEPSITAAP